jgi:hypothetical protein
MRLTSLLPAGLCLLGLSAPSLSAAVVIDGDLTALRALPGAPAVAERLRGAMPEQARERLRQLEAIAGFSVERDLRRAVVQVDDDGDRTLRLVGVPAERLAQLAGDGRQVAAGILHELPQRPGVGLIVLAADEVLVGPIVALERLGVQVPLAPRTGAPLQAHLTPGASPRVPAMAFVREVDVDSDGQGRVTATIRAHDLAAADELERRIGVVRAMVRTGSAGGLPALVELQQVFDGATIQRTGEVIVINATIPEAVRQRLLDRLFERLGSRQVRAG